MAGTALKLVAERPGSIVVHSPFDDFVRKFGTTQRRGIFGYFVHDLGRRIVGGEYPPGATLPNEPDLVAKFGISRTVIREAMKCLAGKGLVEIKTRVGTRVRDRSAWHHTDTDVMVWYYETGPSLEFMRSIKDLRRVLEPEIFEHAAGAVVLEADGAAFDRHVEIRFGALQQQVRRAQPVNVVQHAVHVVGVERLGEKSVGAGLARAHVAHRVMGAGDHHHLHRRRQDAKPLQRLQTREARHVAVEECGVE